MTRYRAIVAYDGTVYLGFQRQAEGIPTIQATLEDAIEHVIHRPLRVTGAGRTDTGVHAEANVIAFEVDWRHSDEALLRALNAALPTDIAIQQLERAAPEFHPRFDAYSRTYRYVVYSAKERNPLFARTAWHLRAHLDLLTMNEAARLILGSHDFATFGNPTQGESTTRYVYRSEWVTEPLQGSAQEARLFTYTVEANGFLHHMVRVLVGALTDVGSGKWSVRNFTDALEAKERGRALNMAPPTGLTLMQVTYDNTDKQRENAPLTGDVR